MVAGGSTGTIGRLFAVWGVIGELPVHPKVRLVGEVNGESTQGQRPNNSALLGVIWQPTSRNLFLDAGVRHGISRAAPDWAFTMGLTFGFSLPRASQRVAQQNERATPGILPRAWHAQARL